MSKNPSILSDGYIFGLIENLYYIPHLHKGIEGVYVRHGSIVATLDGKNYTLQEGDFCLIMPFCCHSFQTPRYSEVLGFSIISDDVLLTNHYFSGKYKLINPVYRDGQYPPPVFQLLNLLTDAETEDGMLVHIGLLHAVIGYLFDTNPPKAVEKSELTQAEQILFYLHENYQKPITLTGAAESLNMSQFKLSRICSQEIGIHFHTYLKSMRISSSKTKLAFTDYNISDIASLCGFESLRTFNRAFQEETGITPREYRKNHKNKLSMDVRTSQPTKRNFTHVMT